MFQHSKMFPQSKMFQEFTMSSQRSHLESATRVPATRVTATRVTATRVPATRVPATRVPATRVPARVRPAGRASVGSPAVDAPSAAAFRRRRVAAGVLGLGLVLVTAHAADAVVHGSATRVSNVQAVHYRVHRGDTLWSIARAVAPNDDPRAVVDLLVQAHGSAVIQPGDVIDWAGR